MNPAYYPTTTEASQKPKDCARGEPSRSVQASCLYCWRRADEPCFVVTDYCRCVSKNTFKMGVMEKIKEIEAEMARTQKNKATNVRDNYSFFV